MALATSVLFAYGSFCDFFPSRNTNQLPSRFSDRFRRVVFPLRPFRLIVTSDLGRPIILHFRVSKCFRDNALWPGAIK